MFFFKTGSHNKILITATQKGKLSPPTDCARDGICRIEMCGDTFNWTLYSGTPTEPDFARQTSAVRPHGTLVTMDAVSVKPYAENIKDRNYY